MTRPGIAVLALLAPTAAYADGITEVRVTADAAIIAGPSLDSEGDADAEPLLYEASLNGRLDHYFDNGARLRVNTALRAQMDHPARPGFSGGFGAQSTATIGAFSGLSAQPAIDQQDPRGRLESFYLQLDGGYGEARVGKDLGVAARFFEGAPSVLTYSRLDSPLLDLSGLNVIKTRHDVTGPSTKLSLASPRWLGIRAGLSYTPEANSDGLDRRPEAGISSEGPDLSGTLELALNTSHYWRRFETEIETGFAWSHADVSGQAASAPYGDMQTTSLGARLTRGDWAFGGSWLTSDNGAVEADYDAWSLGLGAERFGLDWALNYGVSEDDGAALEGEGWRFGAAKHFSKQAKIGLSYTYDAVEQGSQTQQNHGIVVEITLFNEFLDLSIN